MSNEKLDVRKYEGSSDWSALYVDGELRTVGDHYLISEAIENLFKIEVIQSDSFLQGGNQYSDVAKTVQEIEAYDQVVQDKMQKARKLREQARRLELEAKGLLKEN